MVLSRQQESVQWRYLRIHFQCLKTELIFLPGEETLLLMIEMESMSSTLFFVLVNVSSCSVRGTHPCQLSGVRLETKSRFGKENLPITEMLSKALYIFSLWNQVQVIFAAFILFFKLSLRLMPGSTLYTYKTCGIYSVWSNLTKETYFWGTSKRVQNSQQTPWGLVCSG